MRNLCILSSFLLIVAAQQVFKPPTAENCKIGEDWVVEFIKFKCYQVNRGGVITKGVRVVGCVPENTPSGKVILNGSTWQDAHFTYLCNRTSRDAGSILSFKPINCIDAEGKVLRPGESRRMNDGNNHLYKCYIDSENDVHLSVDGSTPGCSEGIQIYKERSAWMRYRPMDLQVAPGKIVRLGIGVATACERDDGGNLVAREYGCITMDKQRVDVDGYGVIDGHVAQCVEGADHKLRMVLANEDLVACKVNGKRVVAGTEWDSADKKERLKCHFGQVIKIGCIIDAQHVITVHHFDYVNGIGYQCGDVVGDGFVNFGKLKGCSLENGTTVEFLHEWNTDSKVLLCRYRIDNGVVSAFVQQIYCRYKKEKVNLAETVAIGKDVVKCELQGREYVARKLSELELKEWKTKAEKAGLLSAHFEALDHEGQGAQIVKMKLPTPAPMKECHDALDAKICQKLAPICTLNSGVDTVGLVHGMLVSGKVDSITIGKVEMLLRGKLPIIPNGNLTATAHALFGAGGTTTGTCAASTPKVTGCNGCANSKAALKNIVQALCAKTCKQCEQGGSLEKFAEAALSFHKSACP